MAERAKEGYESDVQDIDDVENCMEEDEEEDEEEELLSQEEAAMESDR